MASLSKPEMLMIIMALEEKRDVLLYSSRRPGIDELEQLSVIEPLLAKLEKLLLSMP